MVSQDLSISKSQYLEISRSHKWLGLESNKVELCALIPITKYLYLLSFYFYLLSQRRARMLIFDEEGKVKGFDVGGRKLFQAIAHELCNLHV